MVQRFLLLGALVLAVLSPGLAAASSESPRAHVLLDGSVVGGANTAQQVFPPSGFVSMADIGKPFYGGFIRAETNRGSIRSLSMAAVEGVRIVRPRASDREVTIGDIVLPAPVFQAALVIPRNITGRRLLLAHNGSVRVSFYPRAPHRMFLRVTGLPTGTTSVQIGLRRGIAHQLIQTAPVCENRIVVTARAQRTGAGSPVTGSSKFTCPSPASRRSRPPAGSDSQHSESLPLNQIVAPGR